MIIPTAEPFFFPGGSIGVLLVHGFTGAPKEMRWMGEYLHKQGYSVLGIRLAGHATQIEDLPHVKWSDWLNSVEDGYHILKGASEKIVVAGLSMGGILSLLFASQFDVSGVIAMSTPYSLPSDPRMRLLRWLWRVYPYVSKGEPDWQDPTPVQDHIDYPKYPTKAILELKELVDQMQHALPKVRVPALLMHSRQDGGVPPENMELIYEHLGSQDKNMFWLENSGHVVVRDAEKERVFQAADEFIRRVCLSTDQ
jgi:carboxylesterase